MEETESIKENESLSEEIKKFRELLKPYIEAREALFAKYHKTPPVLKQAA